MKINGIICLCAFFVSAHSASASADVYRYTDRHGNVIYTDSLDNVPEEQRAAAKMPGGQSPVPPGFKKKNQFSSHHKLPDDAIDNLNSEQRELEALKSKLNEEFKILAEENARLKEGRKTAVTPDQRKAFNKQVVSFNTRFQAYKEKEAAYQSQLESYNRRLKAIKSNLDH